MTFRGFCYFRAQNPSSRPETYTSQMLTTPLSQKWVGGRVPPIAPKISLL